MEGDMQVCRHCQRSVDSAHFILHEVHCVRFLAICPECKEPIPKKEMEEHFENMHKEVECAMCQQNMQKHLLEVHETKECQMRLVECKFCELAMAFSKLESHEYHCGSRTKHCPHCNQFILLHELASHKDTCQGKQAQPRKGKRMPAAVNRIKCNSCNLMIPVKEYVQHMETCCPVSEFAKLSPFGKPRNAPPSLPSQSPINQTFTAEKDVRPKTKNINRFPLFPENSTKQVRRGKGKPLDLPLRSELKPRNTSPVGNEAAYDILRSCSRCDILLPLPTLNLHKEKCRWLTSSKRKYVRNSS
ncbi:XIAP-associated factor 1 [Orycteropus afer afer]|uniref:XIAP-associated factor 1 n=1 Tax=Orycteropus afer afer TaxID=1230840 RepID=A0AC54Z5H0_ORYAF|nr:XIAP-associated factor 1 [Orycteropus afer afer]